MDNLQDIINYFKDAFREVLVKKGIEPQVDFEINIPTKRDYGDLTTNLALKLSSYLKKTPMEVADDICNSLDTNDLGISKIEVAKPGFINLYLDNKWIKIIGDMVLRNGLNIVTENKPKKILISLYNNEVTEITRAKVYSYILGNILKLKGHNVDLCISNDAYQIKYDEIIQVSDLDAEESSNNDVKFENIKIAGMFASKNNKIINEPIENILDKNLINIWTVSKTYKTKVEIPLETAFINDTINPHFYITYVVKRLSNMILILESEGYDIDKVNNSKLILNPIEGKDLVLKILEFDNVLDEAVKYRESFKVFSYIYELCSMFYQYNNKLLIRELSKEEVLSNLFMFKAMRKFLNEVIELIASSKD